MIQNEISSKREEEKDNSLCSLEIGKQKDLFSKTSYIIKYNRKKNELTELIQDTQLPKAKQSLFMLDFIIVKNNDKSNESLLHIKCHEIAAIHFEDFYEREYSFNDILKENKYFKALDNIEEIKDILDDVLSQNYQNSKKIYIKLENNCLNLHIKLTYFDTMKEIILTIPKKILKPDEKIFFLPMTLKEIQQKMTYYQKENRKYKIKNKSENNCIINNEGFYEYYLKKQKEKEKEEENKSCQHSIINETNDTSNNNSITSEKKKNKKDKKKKRKKIIIKKEKSNGDENNYVNSFY